MTRKQNIENALKILQPSLLEVIDESLKHAGHKGNPNGDEGTHFTIKISSKQLENISRVKQHRTINDLVKGEFDRGLHALSIKIISDTK